MTLPPAAPFRYPRVTDLVVFLVLAGLSLLWFRHNFNYGLDDSYITFRYAQNLAAGEGLCFNPGERHFGSTAMGLALILGVASFLIDFLTRGSIRFEGHLATCGTTIPFLAHALSALSLGMIVWILFKIGERTAGKAAAAIFALASALMLYPAHYLNSVSGHETLFYLSLIFTAFYLIYFLEKTAAPAFILVLATTVRPDCFLAFLIAACFLFIRSCLGSAAARRVLIFLAAYLAPISGWMLFCRSYFGTWLPVTLEAKQVQVLLGHWDTYSLSLLVEQSLGVFGPIAASLLFLLPLLSILVVFAKKASFRRFFETSGMLFLLSFGAFASGQAVFYHLIRITAWWWYYTPVLLLLFLSAPVSVFILLQPVRKGQSARFFKPLLITASLAAVAPAVASLSSFHLWAAGSAANAHIHAYDPVVEYVRANAPHGTSLAMAEPGVVGFNLGPAYHVIDLLGLTSPQVAQRILSGDMDFPYTRWNPEYLVASWDGVFSPTSREWISERYEIIAEFPYPYWIEYLSRGAYLYRRKG